MREGRETRDRARSPSVSQCPVTESFPGDCSAIRPNAARGSRRSGTPASAAMHQARATQAPGSASDASRQCSQRVAALVAVRAASGSSPIPTLSSTRTIRAWRGESRDRSVRRREPAPHGRPHISSGKSSCRPSAGDLMLAMACLNSIWSVPPCSTISAKRSKLRIRPSICWPSISRIVTSSRSRRAKFRNASWMFGWLEATFVSGRCGMSAIAREAQARAR